MAKDDTIGLLIDKEYDFIEKASSEYGFKTPYGSTRTQNAVDEKNNGERLTIDAGYVDPQKQIQQMILAGEQLNSYRMFDEDEALTNDEFADAVAKIRHPNTDINEITTYTEAINNRMQKTRSEAERKAIKQGLEVGTAYKEYEKKDPDEPPDPDQNNQNKG